jgi:hypothetical protein
MVAAVLLGCSIRLSGQSIYGPTTVAVGNSVTLWTNYSQYGQWVTSNPNAGVVSTQTCPNPGCVSPPGNFGSQAVIRGIAPGSVLII